jgi:hypothetical protein
MIKRFTAFTAVLAIAAMTAFGGVAYAQRGTHHHKTTGVKHAVVDGDAIQSGDQTSPDPLGASDAEEPGSEEPGDGPGGHEDEPGSEVDHQFEGEE